MRLSPEDVIRLAHQARFALPEEDVQRMCAELNGVLERLDILQELADVTMPPETGDLMGVRLRADECTSDKLQRSLDALSSEVVAGFFTVPCMMGDGHAR